jgi:hypothetical protein
MNVNKSNEKLPNFEVPSIGDRVIDFEIKEPRCLLQTCSLPAVFPTTDFCFYFHAFLTEVNNPIHTLSERAQTSRYSVH